MNIEIQLGNQNSSILLLNDYKDNKLSYECTYTIIFLIAH